MKLVIDKRLRLIILSIISLSIILVSFLLFKSIKEPGLKEEKASLYSYKNIANVDYKVKLKPNTLYEDNGVLGEGNLIISEFVDSIKANFKYQFEGERTADIKGEYEIVALVEGYTGSGKDQKTIWKKIFPILQKEKFDLKDKILAVDKEVSINFDEYKSFAQSIASSSRVDSQARLSVVMKISLNAVTDKGIIDKNLSPSIVIPLNSSYFEIVKNQGETKPEAIEEVRNIELPVNKKLVTLYIVLLVIAALALTYTIFFIAGAESINQKEKELKKIFKNHGDRMVALGENTLFTPERYYSVWGIEDLVKVSDEIGRPIMYEFSEDIKRIKQFYVCDDKSIYMFNIGETFVERNASGINNKNQVEA